MGNRSRQLLFPVRPQPPRVDGPIRTRADILNMAMDNPFQFTRLQDGSKQRLATLRETLGVHVQRETWLFVSPHDDDLVIDAGLWIQAAACRGHDVSMLVVTHSAMSDCTPQQRQTNLEII